VTQINLTQVSLALAKLPAAITLTLSPIAAFSTFALKDDTTSTFILVGFYLHDVQFFTFFRYLKGYIKIV
jgi:hypothetical protein